MGKFCKNCGHEITNEDKFCKNCGTKKGKGKKFCSNCGCALAEEEKFCGNCGNSIDSTANEESISAQQVNKERKQIGNQKEKQVVTEQEQSMLDKIKSLNKKWVALGIVVIVLIGMLVNKNSYRTMTAADLVNECPPHPPSYTVSQSDVDNVNNKYRGKKFKIITDKLIPIISNKDNSLIGYLHIYKLPTKQGNQIDMVSFTFKSDAEAKKAEAFFKKNIQKNTDEVKLYGRTDNKPFKFLCTFKEFQYHQSNNKDASGMHIKFDNAEIIDD